MLLKPKKDYKKKKKEGRMLSDGELEQMLE